jgi:hypothetical protein
MKESTKNQKVNNFYKKNKKVIHHLFNIPLFFGIMFATGNTEFVNQPVFILLGFVISQPVLLLKFQTQSKEKVSFF